MQVFPKFMVPLAFYWTWQWASQKGMRFLYYALGALVLQFYCGMYLGLMLAYTLFFLVLGFGVAHWRLGVFNGVFKGRNVLLSLVGIVIALVLLMPLMLPYIDASRSIDPRTLDDVINTVPSPRSYFFTHIAASSWHSLVYHGRDALADWWYQFNWVGITPWLVMLALPYLLARSTSLDRPVVIGMISGMALSLAFCLNIGGRSLYELFLSLPGFNAMRSLDRFIHVQVMFFILLFVLALKDLRLPRTMQVLAGIAIPALVIVDNKVITAELKSFPAADDRAQVETISLRIQQQYEPQHAAIAYMPVLGLDAMDDPHMHLIELHLSSMLAAQELGIPIVNAYTGNYPGNYMQFFDHLDRPALEAWCEQEKISADQVEVISNVDLPIRSIEEILITTYSGDTVRYIDPQGGALQLGDAIGGKALLAEQIELMDGRSAFMAGNGMFICAELEDEAQFSATAPQLGDFALFHPVSLLDGSTALRTFNGLFIQADPSTGRLFAGELSGDTLGFRMVPVIP